MCFKGCAEHADVTSFTANCYISPKAILMARDAKVAGQISLMGPRFVFGVGAVLNVAKIVPAVVAWVAVNVVYIAARPSAGLIKVRNSGNLMVFAINAYLHSSRTRMAAGYAPRFPTAPTGDTARKDAGTWIVIQQLAQAFSGQHDKSPVPCEKQGSAQGAHACRLAGLSLSRPYILERI